MLLKGGLRGDTILVFCWFWWMKLSSSFALLWPNIYSLINILQGEVIYYKYRLGLRLSYMHNFKDNKRIYEGCFVKFLRIAMRQYFIANKQRNRNDSPQEAKIFIPPSQEKI